MQLPPVEKRNVRHLNYLCFDENYIEKNKELLPDFRRQPYFGVLKLSF